MNEPIIDNLEEFIRFDKGIDVAEDQIADGVRESLRNRWEFGKLMLAKRKGKQLPNGMLDELAEATGKSRSELKYRMQFAERYPTEDEVARALATFTSWTQVKRNLPKPPPPPRPQPTPSQPKPSSPPPTPKPSEPVAREPEAKAEPEVDARRLDQDIVDWNSLPGTAKEKVERVGRQIRREFQKKLEEAEEKLKAEYEEKLEAGLAHRRKLMDDSHAQSRRVLDARKGIMTKADYDLIRRCLHPDTKLVEECR